jgi:hypothetical protein
MAEADDDVDGDAHGRDSQVREEHGEHGGSLPETVSRGNQAPTARGLAGAETWYRL